MVDGHGLIALTVIVLTAIALGAFGVEFAMVREAGADEAIVFTAYVEHVPFLLAS